MFNKTIFKQSLKSNKSIWIIFTGVTTALLSLLIGNFNPSAFDSLMSVFENAGMVDSSSSALASMSSLMGSLGQNFYSMLAIILPLIYVIIVANNLVVSEVDRGAMAYTLSTPIKRSSVIFTKAAYLVLSLVLMFSVMAGVGIITAQITQKCVWGVNYTADVKAASKYLNESEATVAGDLNLILGNSEALSKGAVARDMDIEEYTVYLGMTMQQNAYKAAAKVLDVKPSVVENDISIIKTNKDALKAAADELGMDVATYSTYIDTSIAQKAVQAEQTKDLTTKMSDGLTAAARELKISVPELSSNMNLMKENPAALKIACEKSELDETIFTSMINASVASKAVKADKGTDFDLNVYLLLNLGCFLLIFAISSISFFASCLFNLSKNAMAIVAGVPLTFFVLNIVAGMSDSLANAKYFTLNTLYDASAIQSGTGYIPQLIVLGVIGLVFYMAGLIVFKKKDLPL